MMAHRATRMRRIAGAIVLAATGMLLAAPADAQLFERRQDFFPFSLFGDRGGPPPSGYPRFGGVPQQPMESAKAPPPRKPETAPTSTVLVVGDSLADWLAYGLEETLTDTPDIGVVRKIRPFSGLVRYDPRNENLEWSQAVKEMLASEQPSVIVVMLGLNDRQALRERINPKPQKQEAAAPAGQGQGQGQAQGEAPAAASGSEPGQQPSAENATPAAPPAAPAAPANEPPQRTQMVSYEFHTDKWGEAYAKRVDEMIAALKAKGVPVVWVGLPAIRTRTTSDITYLDEIYRTRAARAGVVYVDVWDGFVDERGGFAVQGPDFEGQIRRLRTGDGIHFTKPGAVKLAHYVEHDLRRVMANRPVPVAVPGTDEQAPKAPGTGTRAAVGAVVPLNAGAAETGDLLGAGGTPAAGGAAADPLVARVISRGDAIAAPPAGRADNFSWPRAGATANISNEVEIVPSVAPAAAAPAAPAAAAAKGPPAKGAATVKKPEAKPETKPDAKKEATPETPPLRSPRRTRAELDGVVRPPSPVGPGPTNVR
jgi:hypothetical protein